MIVLEFAAQGVRGVAPSGGRAALRPGYNVVAAEGPVLRRLLQALLHPDPRDAEALPRPAGAAAAGVALRAGLTLLGNDRITYRLVRDFLGQAQLHRFDAERRSFTLLATELPEITGLLQGAGVPESSRLQTLLTLSAADLPSRQAGVAAGVAPPRQTHSGLTREENVKRMAQLRGELTRSRAAEGVQARLDEIAQRTFKADEVLKAGAQAREGLARAEEGRAELDGLAAAAARLGEVGPRLEQYQRAAAKREESLARVAGERAALDELEAGGPPLPFWRDPSFWGGVAGGGLLAALFASLGSALSSGSVRLLMVADIPAFGWSAWVATRWIGAQERWEQGARRRRVLEELQKKVEAQHGKDDADVVAALQAAGAKGLPELKEALGRLADADAVVAEWRRRLAEWEATPEAAEARVEKERLEEERQRLEGQLSEQAGGFVREVATVEAEMKRLEAEAAAPPPAPAPKVAAPREPAADPLRSLLERAGAELGASAAGAGRGLAPKASQALSGLSFQRLAAVQVDDRGGLHAVVSGRATAVATLAPADRDLVWLSLKLALLEQAVQAMKATAVVEDAFGGLSDGARRFAARLLKQAARGGQILHATSDAVFREAADHVA